MADEQSTEDYVLHGRTDTFGLAGLKQSVRDFVTGWSDMHINLDELIAEGDKVASRWTVRGTNRRQQTKMALMMLGISRFVDDKIVEEWVAGQPIEQEAP